MAFLPGLKKQFNKANQFMSERITGVEGTKLDPEFAEMERRADVFNELVEDLQVKTKEYLQPNPTVRAKMAAVKGISKLSGQAKASTYPQPEGTLGDAMCTYGKKLQDFDFDSVFASSLVESGESLKQMADLKYALDDNVKQNFLEPLHHTQSKDLREVMHHRKKLQGRKLDFDCKKRTGARDDEIKQAEDKFAESLHLSQLGMHNLMEGSGVEHISQLTQFAESLLEYHKNCTTILQTLTDALYEKTNEASLKPKAEFRPKTLEDLGIDRDSDYNLSARSGSMRPGSSNSNLPVASSNLMSSSPGGSQASTPTHGNNGDAWNPRPSPKPSPATTPTRHSQPSCQALYDFEAENPGELSFKEGDTIMLKSQIDDNWYDGSVRGKSGLFPVSYVNIVNPLP
eukprot:snap_masked-scaffold589_size129586-processed-gene-0.8 protein:Tk07335 transcript:snap_masked-scaffold589_size129586-processed-gene-0.8-mRNA-1 annotation:"endophilin-a isoform x11"